mmetsp:Transcript_92826/g.145841  ORF Transcript_92826/g.145841 Transcript_92826/m.145841 type:complete len:97 (-) Transcript_92826:84-374(-)
MVCHTCNFGLCRECYSAPLDNDLQMEDPESAEALSNLCGLGFSYWDAKNALAAANGDVEQAASLLLAAAAMDVDTDINTGGHFSSSHALDGPVIID